MTKKIVAGAVSASRNAGGILRLGNLSAQRDWGHAKDYVKMQWLMLQQDKPDDFIIATGRTETVRKFIELSATKIGWNNHENSIGIIWEGKGLNEIGRRADTKEIVVRIDKRYFRPTEVDQLLGDATKAFNKLGWKPKTSLEDLIEEMITFDSNEAQKEAILKKKGFEIYKSLES
mgnify:CR=1 FL=1